MQLIAEHNSEVLDRALRHLSSFPVDPLERTVLHKLVCAFVDERRAERWSPEQITLAVKRAAFDAGLHSPFGRTAQVDATAGARDALVHDMVDWCMHRYYVHSE